LPLNSSGSGDPKLTLGSDGFYDSEGKRVFFRGINVSSNAKIPPFIPFKDPVWWGKLRDWGFNMIRLTLFWEAIEPEQGCYNEKYLSKVKEMVDQATSMGLYILLDMHQDLFSRWLHGDGAPSWAFPNDVDPNNNDSFGGQFWGLAYFESSAVKACFTNFFQSRTLRDHYRDAVVQVATLVKDNPYVLGYDIMNEPSNGNLSNFLGDFENGFLEPLYEETIIALRQVHKDAVGFIEPDGQDTYTSMLMPFSTDRLVYAPHMYDNFSNAMRYKPLPEGTLFEAMAFIHRLKAAFLGMPLFIGEYGAPWTMQPEGAREVTVDESIKAIESSFIDSAYWDYSVKDVNIWNEEDFSIIDQNEKPRGLEVNVRPYLRRLRGTPLSRSFDRKKKTYVASFKTSPDWGASIFYLPEAIHYPNGFEINASGGHTEFDEASEELSYYPSYNGNHSLIIKPA
jgi:endoglycosylceramidase